MNDLYFSFSKAIGREEKNFEFKFELCFSGKSVRQLSTILLWSAHPNFVAGPMKCGGSPPSVVANVLDCDTVVSEFEL